MYWRTFTSKLWIKIHFHLLFKRMYKNSHSAILSISEYCPESPFSTLLLLQLDLRSTSNTATGSQNETHPSTYKSAQFIIHNRCLSSYHTDIIITTCRSVLPLHYLTLKLHFCETLTHPHPHPLPIRVVGNCSEPWRQCGANLLLLLLHYSNTKKRRLQDETSTSTCHMNHQDNSTFCFLQSTYVSFVT